MALPENSIGFSDLIPLGPEDLTDEVLDRLHSRVDEGAVLSWALARHVVRKPVARTPVKYLDPADDADLFEEIMR
jgi:hypothetical protein